MKRADAPEYVGRLNVVTTKPLVEAVARAAHRNELSINAYVRRALLMQLRADGIQVEREFEAA